MEENLDIQTYIGVKMIKAWPEDRVVTVEGDDRGKKTVPGYGVQYPDGYTSWSPKDVFEAAYLPMGEHANTAHDIAASALIASVDSQQVDEKSVLTTIATRTGFLTHGLAVCAEPVGFDMEIGKRESEARARGELNKYIEFVIQWALRGLNR